MLEHPVPILYLVVKKGNNIGASSPNYLPSVKEGYTLTIVMLEQPTPILKEG